MRTGKREDREIFVVDSKEIKKKAEEKAKSYFDGS
jgi:hypothetical protein